MASRATKREAYRLRGGPLAGHTVRLARGDHTLPLALRGQVGRYQWVEGGNVLHWQPSQPAPAQGELKLG